MKQRSRKFAGIWLILLLLVVYPLAVAFVYTEYLAWLPIWASLVVFLVLGVAWALPAGMIIKWMAKPDAAN